LGPVTSRTADIRVGEPGITEVIHVPGRAPVVLGHTAGTTPKASGSAASRSNGSPQDGQSKYTHN
jgi:hypothetical protein